MTTFQVEDPAVRLGPTRFVLEDIVVGPTTHLAAERERLAALTWEHFDVRRIGSTVGAELHGLDLTSELPEVVINEIRRALHDYKVIFFRNQPLTSEQHVAFASRFGELELHPFLPGNAGLPELVRFAKSAEVAGYENSWHHDVTWRDEPSMGAVLHGIEVPECGGDTLFCDMYAAYEGLPAELRDRIDHLDAEHDYMRSFGRQVPPERQAEVRAQYPVVVHPVAAVHPVTGRRHLYVNRNFTERIVGVDADESRRLIELLARQAETVEYQCRFHWEPHSVAFWDNRAVQHYASSDYWPDVRVMERASIIGAKPTR